MTVTAIIIFPLIGAVAGWLAGLIMKGGGFGLVGDIVVGVIGSFIGGWLFSLLGIAAGGLIGAFFFQAEDGIRLGTVTGVQTCALPIWDGGRRPAMDAVMSIARRTARVCRDRI